ncbi:flagellar biosynthesis protein FlhA [Natronospira proteinivora]|uniref:Flagellar biosynthesis protein FlhA n=1 Tax=Natronospira proteinivora TaxID=1807133 RepID=A0ABT1G591_9GAMM|nr:flagellar biosynthesis protein FlhA [Natronospira proteinivora]MCP1726450.1 flagellar biosynthesis protein FlhA [Natronospira proteinivora]
MASTQSMVTDGFKHALRSGLGVPILLLAVLGMIIVPLPPIALDMFFTFNIALALIVVLAVIYIARPLDLGVFPTVLLAATVLRLALNIASTRVILLEGHTGTAAAGRVIESFGQFVVGGNYAVGLVVFAILVIINFVVITKGATRVSEVTARFTLDAMPGKQMAIDADLNAGLLTDEQARDRRQEIREEADFYGSMDGASKFVRGDAIAGILIMIINIVGGLVIGPVQHGLSLAEAGRNYTLLTIGDGLVAQIPALLLSTAVAVIVTRMSRSQDMGQQILTQLVGNGRVLAVASGVLFTLGVIPGMPNLAFLSLAAITGFMAWRTQRKGELVDGEPVDDEVQPAGGAHRDRAGGRTVEPGGGGEELGELGWEDVTQNDLLGLEVGYRLIPLVDRKQGGELMTRIRGVRKKLSRELGFLVQSVHIRDNLELPPNYYRLTLMGDPVGEAEIHPDREMAINPGQVHGKIQGIETTDPAFGLEAVWIESEQRDNAQTLGYTVVDPATVVATHLSHVIQSHAHELLGHEEVQKLLDMLKQTDKRLVESLVPDIMPLNRVVKVLQRLLEERVPIRNLRTIAESLAEHGTQTQDPEELVGQVRVALARTIVQEVAGTRDELPVITLDPKLEQILQDALRQGGTGSIEPGLAERLQQSLAEATEKQENQGEPGILLVAPLIRSWLARFLRQPVPGLNVLSYNEIPDSRKVRLVASISGE